MHCPHCATALGTGRHEGVTIHGCSSCSGRFVGFAELKQIISDASRPRPETERAAAAEQAGTAATRPDSGSPVVACPECATTMRRYVYQYDTGVWIDACDAHGVWLDAGELERLEAIAEAIAAGASITPAASSSTVGVERPEVAKFDVHDPYGSPLSRSMSSYRQNVLHDFVVNASRRQEAAQRLADEASIEEMRTLAEAIVESERNEPA